MADKKTVIFVPKKGKAAEWAFHPSAQVRKNYPDAEVEFLGMDAQEGEILSLIPVSQETLKQMKVVTVDEGRVELLNFDHDWQEGKTGSSNAENVWDIDQMISAWSSAD